MKPEEHEGPLPKHDLTPSLAVAPPPPIQRWSAGISAATTAPFADLARTQTSLEALQEFTRTRQVHVRFSNLTGLVRSLRGEPFPETRASEPGERTAVARAFLDQHQDVLFGTEDQPWHLDQRPTIGANPRFIQTDGDGIPVYGGTATFGFRDDGQLTSVDSSWFPLPTGASFPDRFELSWEAAIKIAIEFVTRSLERAADEPKQRLDDPEPPWFDIGTSFEPPSSLDAIPGDNLAEGRVIFPRTCVPGEAGPAPPDYRPAWAVLVIDRKQYLSWKVFVDAEKGRVLAAFRTTVGANVQGCVFRTNDDVSAGNATTVALFDTGGAPGTLANAPGFELIDHAAVALQGCLHPTTTDDRKRIANLYFHLTRAREAFATIVDEAWPAAGNNQALIPGQTGQRLRVSTPNTPTTAIANPALDTLIFGTGDTAHVPPIGDPARDCEVIYHEYTHAVLHRVQPDLCERLYECSFGQVINEGTAFYFGCTLSERIPADQLGILAPSPAHCWGEVAYGGPGWQGFRDLERTQGQSADHDYLRVYGVFPSYAGGCHDPVESGSTTYACGMIWARALWDVRRALGYPLADAIILRGLSLSGGFQCELETPAEAIIQADLDRSPPSHESALRLIFASRGIMADSPIHDLIAVDIGAKTHVLAATEGTGPGGSSSGCLIMPHGSNHTWQALGSILVPRQAVALAAAKIDDSKVLIWAASEERTNVGGQVKPSSYVYRYELNFNGQGDPINLSTNWDQDRTPNLPSVLCLAAMPKNLANPAAGAWVFAGTENGLYVYDDATNQWPTAPKWWPGVPIFSLTVMEQPQRRLLVATAAGVHVIDPLTMSIAQQFETQNRPYRNTLHLVPDPTTPGHLVAATACDEFYRFDPASAPAPDWHPGGLPDLGRPVYRLLVEPGAAGAVVHAGTNNGVYRLGADNLWHTMNNSSGQFTETIEGTVITAMCRAGGQLMVGTAQRGIWIHQNGAWERLANGLPRISQAIDLTASAGGRFGDNLPASGVGTHVFYVGPNNFQFLACTDRPGLALFYVAPYTDIAQGHLAGLQDRDLIPAAGGGTSGLVMDAPVSPGFYLLTVTGQGDYQIDISLA